MPNITFAGAWPMRSTVFQRRSTQRALMAVAIGAMASTMVAARLPVLPGNGITPRADGLTFTYTVTSSSADKKQREAANQIATVRIQDGNVRMDFSVGSAMAGQKGVYMLVLGEATQFAMVSDKDKQVMIMDAATFGSGMGALANNPLLKVTPREASFSFQDMGPGEKMLGYSTQHVRVMHSSSMEAKILGMTRKSSSADTSDQWIAHDLGVDAGSLLAWSKSFGAGVKITSPELAAQMDKYQQQYGKSGIVMRSVTRSARTDNKGKVQSDSLTMEVTDLKKGEIDASMFKYPGNYKVVNVGEQMASFKAAMDSAKNADAAKKKKGGE
jgi:hypothetical protein